ncbi:MAG: T9SS type A sorting domain-containing protein [Bacteroidota bacterium]
MKNLFLALSFILAFTANLQSGIKYVTAIGSGAGTSWSDAASFQSALTAATSGDQIWVAKGTHKPSSAYDLTNTSRYYHFRMINGVAIYGGFAGTESVTSQRTSYGVGGTNETILSGDLNNNGKDDNDCYHIFYHPSGLSLTSSAILDGFTIKGGNANAISSDPHYHGGGMYNSSSSPTITNCTFTSNSATYQSGGMYNWDASSPTITNCTFSLNSAGTYGGGMINQAGSNPIITNCTFSSNSAGTGGGGMYNNGSSPTLTNCTFTSNSASSFGGGLANSTSSSTITNCTFKSNSSASGGGMYNYLYSATLINCVFTSNLATTDGGGMNNYTSSPTLTNCTFSLNSATYRGGGMFNYYGGVSTDYSSPTLNNCIIWGNVATDGHEFFIYDGTTTLNYSCYTNLAGDIYINTGTFTATNNNITTDPQFVGSSINATHPYSILGTSSCVDVGYDSYNSQVYDIRGAGYARKSEKIAGATGTIDMGAYEYKLNADALPVELTSFAASTAGVVVTLHWQTATEVNNFGFEIEKSRIRNTEVNSQNKAEAWARVGFVEGNGTTNAPKEYSYSDKNMSVGKYSYRLKQIDRDGKFTYSQSVEVTFEQSPKEFALKQNYPNPFNPSTVIGYQIPNSSKISLKVFDAIGREVVTLVNEVKETGTYSVRFDGATLSSGIYFAKLTSAGKTQIRKLLLMK